MQTRDNDRTTVFSAAWTCVRGVRMRGVVTVLTGIRDTPVKRAVVTGKSRDHLWSIDRQTLPVYERPCKFPAADRSARIIRGYTLQARESNASRLHARMHLISSLMVGRVIPPIDFTKGPWLITRSLSVRYYYIIRTVSLSISAMKSQRNVKSKLDIPLFRQSIYRNMPM